MKINIATGRLVCSASILALGLKLTAPQAVAATIGWWRFEEGTPGSPAVAPNSILDYSGNNLNGTPDGELYSSDVSPWSSAIGSTRSLHYDGLEHVYVADNPKLQLTHSITIEAIFKSEPMAPGTGAGANLLFRGDTRPSLDPYRLSLLQPGNGLVFQIQDQANNTASISYTVPFDQWVFAAATLDDATGQMNLYVNGNLVASTKTSIRPFGVLDPNYAPGVGIGSNETAQYGELFNGWIDEVRLSDVALNPTEFLVVVPEPSTITLFGVGVAALVYFTNGKKSKRLA